MVACRIVNLLSAAMVEALMMAPPLAQADMSLSGDVLGSVRSYTTI